MYYIGSIACDPNYLAHHGIKGQKWGIRRYQNPDGTLTAEGQERYGGLTKRQLSRVSAYEKYNERRISKSAKKLMDLGVKGSKAEKSGNYRKEERIRKATEKEIKNNARLNERKSKFDSLSGKEKYEVLKAMSKEDRKDMCRALGAQSTASLGAGIGVVLGSLVGGTNMAALAGGVAGSLAGIKLGTKAFAPKAYYRGLSTAWYAASHKRYINMMDDAADVKIDEIMNRRNNT